jgi:hypothetical protein
VAGAGEGDGAATDASVYAGEVGCAATHAAVGLQAKEAALLHAAW